MTAKLSQEKINEYQQNGVVHIKHVIGDDWIDRMLSVIDAQMENPGQWANDSRADDGIGRMFTDRYQWRNNAEIRAFVHEGTLAALAGQAMQSSSARFYFDHLLVKDPNTTAPTPWHQDVPYWPFKGRQICSIWVALTETTVEESALGFVAGSHLDGNYYKPKAFSRSKGNPNAKWQDEGEGVPVPPIEQDRSHYNIVGWDVESGDALIFSAWTLHGAPGNSSSSKRRAAISTRWLGDDAIWFPHAGADPTIKQEDVAVEPGQSPKDDAVFPCIWSNN